MVKPCLTLDAEGHHTGFRRAYCPPDLFLRLGDPVDVIDPNHDIRVPANVTGFDGEQDEYVLLQVDWDEIRYEETVVV